MRRTFTNAVGGVVSADIAVPEHQQELAFYSSVLTTGDTPLWRKDLTNNLGVPVVGLGARTPEYESLPLQWMPHLQVADVATSVTHAIAAGGQEIMHGKTEDGQSQWAVLADPTGATFGVIPVVADETGGTTNNEPCGCIAWLSLAVRDVGTSQDFYQRVIGWNARSTAGVAGQAAKFEMLMDKEIAAAEIRELQNEEAGIPSVWLVHLLVADLGESLRRVSDGGGSVIREYPNAKYAVIRDPVGAYLALQASRDV